MRSLINWFLSPNFDRYKMSNHDIQNVVDLILTKYQHNAKNDELIINKSSQNIELNIPLINKDVYHEHKCLSPIIKIMELLAREKNPFIKHALIHGSLKDMNYIPGWSDLDTWIVIIDDVLEDKNHLLELKTLFIKLNKFLLEVDPIAHHGFILLFESDLDNYDESIMPVSVLEKAGSLIENDKININVDIIAQRSHKFADMRILFENFIKTGEFCHHPYMGKYLTITDIENNEGMYQLKYLISLIMSVPVLYFTEIKKPVYKSESFELFSSIFSKYDDIIYIFSDIRNSWGNNENHPYLPNKIPQWVTKKIPKNFIEQIILLLIKIEEDLSKKIKIL
tara:strand:- start:468 stop:1481 length:1014 start_codon:yes stop_codon:yes gene_type:complete